MNQSDKRPLRFGFHRLSPDEPGYSFKMSGINVYLFVSCILLTLGLSAWLLVRNTPLATWAGVTGKVQNKEAKALEERMLLLQERIEAQDTYITSLKNQLSGNYGEPSGATVFQDTPRSVEESFQVTRIPLDDSLRQRVLKSNLNLPVRTPVILNVSNNQDLEDEFLIPPIRGVVRKSFAQGERHFGVDIVAPENSAVKATLDGQVIESDWTLEGGNTIVIQHDYNLISIYKHNSALLKKKGDLVQTGEAIAIIGNTGIHSDGPHVHFELWYDGEPLDPEAYIELTKKHQ